MLVGQYTYNKNVISSNATVFSSSSWFQKRKASKVYL